MAIVGSTRRPARPRPTNTLLSVRAVPGDGLLGERCLGGIAVGHVLVLVRGAPSGSTWWSSPSTGRPAASASCARWRASRPGHARGGCLTGAFGYHSFGAWTTIDLSLVVVVVDAGHLRMEAVVDEVIVAVLPMLGLGQRGPGTGDGQTSGKARARDGAPDGSGGVNHRDLRGKSLSRGRIARVSLEVRRRRLPFGGTSSPRCRDNARRTCPRIPGSVTYWTLPASSNAVTRARSMLRS